MSSLGNEDGGPESLMTGGRCAGRAVCLNRSGLHSEPRAAVTNSSPYYDAPRYRSGHSSAESLHLLLWRVIGETVFRLIPSPLASFRNTVLGLFGAKLGHGVFVHPSCRIYAPWNLTLGDRSCLSARVDCYSVAEVVIGADVTVSQDAFLCTASHDIDRADRRLVTGPIRIDRGAWVFARATILPGVTVGEGAVVAACAVVTHDVASHSVVAGNPARHVRQRNFRGASEEPGDQHA